MIGEYKQYEIVANLEKGQFVCRQFVQADLMKYGPGEDYVKEELKTRLVRALLDHLDISIREMSQDG